jgi:hypothetical protein
MSRSKLPPFVADYFGVAPDRTDWVTLSAIYDGQRWKTHKARPSLNKMLALRHTGITMVAFQFGNRIADFTISECTGTKTHSR